MTSPWSYRGWTDRSSEGLKREESLVPSRWGSPLLPVSPPLPSSVPPPRDPRGQDPVETRDRNLRTLSLGPRRASVVVYLFDSGVWERSVTWVPVTTLPPEREGHEPSRWDGRGTSDTLLPPRQRGPGKSGTPCVRVRVGYSACGPTEGTPRLRYKSLPTRRPTPTRPDYGES